MCVLDERGATIFADTFEARRARIESHDCEIKDTDLPPRTHWAVERSLKNKKPCTDCQDIVTLQCLQQELPALTLEQEIFSDVRMIKDSEEIRIIREASSIIDSLFGICTEKMAVGQRESELQSILMCHAAGQEMFDCSHESTLYPLIIASGSNGSHPHAQATPKKFQEGDLVVVDIALRYKGYVSDATRTFAVGKPTEEAVEIYNIVKESQRRGVNLALPNKPCCDLDGACRGFIQDNGYKECCMGPSGHGIGLEVHESPVISWMNHAPLEENMVITVEPGIYIPGKLGVRIEDTVVVGQRPIIMHEFTKELVSI